MPLLKIECKACDNIHESLSCTNCNKALLVAEVRLPTIENYIVDNVYLRCPNCSHLENSFALQLNKKGEYFGGGKIQCPSAGCSSYIYFSLGDIHEVKRALLAKQSEKNDNCFIATAVYESSNTREVVLLRRFRDTYLQKNRVGRSFVRFYYKIGPRAAKIIASSKFLKAFVRKALTLIVSRI